MYKVEGYIMFKGSTLLTYCIRDKHGCLIADRIPTEKIASDMVLGLNMAFSNDNIRKS